MLCKPLLGYPYDTYVFSGVIKWSIEILRGLFGRTINQGSGEDIRAVLNAQRVFSVTNTTPSERG